MLKEKIDDFTASVKKNIKTILMDSAVALVAVSYVVYQLLTLEPTGLNPLVLLGQALLGIIAGILIKMGIGENGFIKGYSSMKWFNAFERYNEKCNVALPYIEHSNEYREKEKKEKLERIRKTRLANHRMKYDDWYDENGDFIEHEIMLKSKFQKLKKNDPKFEVEKGTMVLTFKQIKALYKSSTIKVYPLDLFSEYDANNEEDTKKETTDKDIRSMNAKRNVIFAIAIAILGVYFVPNWKWDTGHFLWALMQVALWIGFGVLQLYSNYEYITIDKVQLLARKEKSITKFCKIYMTQEEFEKSGLIESKEAPKIEVKTVDPMPVKKPKEQEFIEIEMTEEELKAKGLIK